MSAEQYHRVDMGKYFNIKQKAYLINVSDNRDQEQYESLSGAIVGRNGDVVTLQISYSTDYASPESQSQKHTFKLNTEAMGSGIQVIADLIRVEAGNIFTSSCAATSRCISVARFPALILPSSCIKSSAIPLLTPIARNICGLRA
jgi:hypothetical protein